MPFAIGAMGTALRGRVIDSGAEEDGPGVHRIWANIGNDGFLTAASAGQSGRVDL